MTMPLFHRMLCGLTMIALTGLLGQRGAADVVDFDDLVPNVSYPGPGGGAYWYGSDDSEGFASRGVEFSNTFFRWPGTDQEYWEGWAYSNTTDVSTPGFDADGQRLNEFSAYVTDTNHEPSVYGVYFQGWGDAAPTIRNIEPGSLQGAYITNTTHTALTILNGDRFARKFTHGDLFLLTITGLDEDQQVTGVREFELADYRDSDPDNHYVVDTWTWVDLTELGLATQLKFELTSTDNDEIFGMNTPGYFAMDDLRARAVPEPSSWALLAGGAVVLFTVGRHRRRG